MTVSISRISGGDGYRYLMSSVVAGDGDRRAANPLTRYYAESGTPPGRWIGCGLAGVGLALGSPVSEDQLFRLLGMACSPVSGEPLGRAPRHTEPTLAQRIHGRLAELPAGLSADARAGAIAKIAEEERARPASSAGRAVAGFDLTFSVPKSVSALWALADGPLQAQIAHAHQDAIADALAYAETSIFATRIGTNGVAQVPVRGVIAAAFDHWDTRSNDPHLHTHVVIANRVQTRGDDRWRTLDSRALFRATVALSELHQGLLMDRLTRLLGTDWEPRPRRHSKVPRWAVVGVPDVLCAEFATRGAAIEARKDRLVTAYRNAHGREPSAATVLKLRQQATLTDRPDKQVHSLADLTASWRSRAAHIVGADTGAWARRALSRPVGGFAVQDERGVQRVAESTLTEVQNKRATFTRWNVYAEACRQLQAVRFASAEGRLRVTDRVADSALGMAVLLAAPDLAHTPSILRRPDGSSAFRRPAEAPYTTMAILNSERRLLEAGRETCGPRAVAVPGAVEVQGHARTLGSEQTAVVQQIATSGRTVDVLVGPAGTGKTATLAGLVTAWHADRGLNSVIGLAPSATAAEVLGEHIGIGTENTAKWLVEADREPERLARIDQLRGSRAGRSDEIDRLISEVERWRIRQGQLVIVDEASLAGTLTLDRIVDHARAVGAKVLLVGDWAQMSAVEAGGAFAMLVRDRDQVPELTHVRRFSHRWERSASVQLRTGDVSAIDRYQLHNRIADGELGNVIDTAYEAWLRDDREGRTSLLIAADRETVTQLNARAHDDLVASGRVSARGARLSDGATAGVGDRIVTRQNARTLATSRGWVKNGDRWTVVGAGSDGSLTARRYRGTSTVRLPADYVAEHVELGYATTAHRAQGKTVDTAHVVVSGPTLNRETLYVAMTRGRHANHLYVATDYHRDPDTQHGPRERQSARDVLAAIVTNAGADISAHETIRAAQDAATSWPQLIAEYDTLAADAEEEHWCALVRSALPAASAQSVIDSDAFGALTTALRRIDACGVDMPTLLKEIVESREVVTAEDIGSVLHERVERFIASNELRPQPARLIAGLCPVAHHCGDPDMRRALDDRVALLERRANVLAERAVLNGAEWVRRLGFAPTDPAGRAAYVRCLRTVAAYRDQWGVTGPNPLGAVGATRSARMNDRVLAQSAAIAARRLASHRAELSDLGGMQLPSVEERWL